VQAARLWHAGINTVTIEACLPPSVLFFGAQACVEHSTCFAVLTFIRAATAATDHGAAHVTLLRLLGALHDHTLDMGGSGSAIGDNTDGVDASRRQRLLTLGRFRDSERCFLHTVKRYMSASQRAQFFLKAARQSWSEDASVEADGHVDSGSLDGLVCIHDGRHCEPSETAPQAAMSNGKDVVGKVVQSPCGVCVASAPAYDAIRLVGTHESV